ncbi:hypothetical protein [Streptomyces sp. NPDC058612]|uniref:hypothetical protein n=1 Tax=Streptomyces sp. NPDC058612 TaxID=3346555 RepID=UPI003648BFA5
MIGPALAERVLAGPAGTAAQLLAGTARPAEAVRALAATTAWPGLRAVPARSPVGSRVDAPRERAAPFGRRRPPPC